MRFKVHYFVKNKEMLIDRAHVDPTSVASLRSHLASHLSKVDDITRIKYLDDDNELVDVFDDSDFEALVDFYLDQIHASKSDLDIYVYSTAPLKAKLFFETDDSKKIPDVQKTAPKEDHRTTTTSTCTSTATARLPINSISNDKLKAILRQQKAAITARFIKERKQWLEERAITEKVVAKIQKYKSELERLVKEKDDDHQQLHQAILDRDALRKDKERESQSFDKKLKEQSSELNATTEKYQKQVEVLQEKIAQYNERIKKVKDSTAATKETLNNQIKNIQDKNENKLKSITSKYKKEMANVNHKYDTLRQTLKASEKTLQSSSNNFNSTINSIKKDKADLMQKFEQKNEINAQLISKVKSIESEKANLEKTVEQLNEQLVKSKQVANELNKSMMDREKSEQMKLKETLRDTDKQLTVKDSMIAEKDSKIAVLEEEINKYKMLYESTLTTDLDKTLAESFYVVEKPDTSDGLVEILSKEQQFEQQTQLEREEWERKEKERLTKQQLEDGKVAVELDLKDTTTLFSDIKDKELRAKCLAAFEELTELGFTATAELLQIIKDKKGDATAALTEAF